MEQFQNIEEIVWVQEEPRNMGAWYFVEGFLNKIKRKDHMLRYLGRPRRSAPAVGELNIHNTGQSRIINAALSIEKKSILL